MIDVEMVGDVWLRVDGRALEMDSGGFPALYYRSQKEENLAVGLRSLIAYTLFA
jgi:hypothetical protein